jgi:hypothetical protein
MGNIGVASDRVEVPTALFRNESQNHCGLSQLACLDRNGLEKLIIA